MLEKILEMLSPDSSLHQLEVFKHFFAAFWGVFFQYSRTQSGGNYLPGYSDSRDTNFLSDKRRAVVSRRGDAEVTVTL